MTNSQEELKRAGVPAKSLEVDKAVGSQIAPGPAAPSGATSTQMSVLLCFERPVFGRTYIVL